jgi:hypothetical protein
MKKVIAVLVVLVALGCGIAQASNHDPGYRTSCFPKQYWQGGHGERPCDVIGQPREDGSNYVLMQTANDEVAICYLPNPKEERGKFVAHCHRTPSTYEVE